MFVHFDIIFILLPPVHPDQSEVSTHKTGSTICGVILCVRTCIISHTQCTCWVTHLCVYWGMFCKIIWVLFGSVKLFFLSIKKNSFCAVHYTHMCTVISPGFQAIDGGTIYEWLHRTNNQRHMAGLQICGWQFMQTLCIQGKLKQLPLLGFGEQ